MPEAGFFVRVRGKVSGPYGIDSLQRMVRTGGLSRVHEISADRTNWTRASEYEELFPAPASSSMPPPPPPRRAGASAVVEDAPFDLSADSFPDGIGEVAPGAGTDRFYYSQNGVAVGPVSMSVLQLLAQNGTLAGESMVWREGAENASPARQVTALAATFSAAPSSGEAWGGATQAAVGYQAPRNDLKLKFAFQRAVSASTFGGIVAGAILVCSMMLPWAVVNGRALWWWDTPDNRARDIGAYLLAAGFLLCIISPITKGLARAICFISVAGIPIMYGAMAIFIDGRSAADSISALFLLPALAAMCGVCTGLAAVPRSTGARVLLGLFSGIVLFTMLTFFIEMMARRESYSDAPSEFIGVLVIVVLGALAATAAAITGFVNLKPVVTPALNFATRILAMAGIALPLLATLFAIVDLFSWTAGMFHVDDQLSSNLRFQVFQVVLRSLAMLCALLVVLGTGLFELLVASNYRAKS